MNDALPVLATVTGKKAKEAEENLEIRHIVGESLNPIAPGLPPYPKLQLNHLLNLKQGIASQNSLKAPLVANSCQIRNTWFLLFVHSQWISHSCFPLPLSTLQCRKSFQDRHRRAFCTPITNHSWLDTLQNKAGTNPCDAMYIDLTRPPMYTQQ